MKLNNLLLNNYRCYSNFEIELGEKTTILIGKNGTGKTTIISAIKQALSFIFSKKEGEIQYEFIASSDQKVMSFSSTDPYYGKNIFEQDYQYPIKIKSSATLFDRDSQNEERLEWTFSNMTSNSGLKDSEYRGANASYWNYYLEREQPIDLPIFAYFSDSYPHVMSNLGSKIRSKIESGNELPRNTSYYKWNDERNCAEIWETYFIMQWKNRAYNSSKGNEDYINQVTQKLIEFSKPLSPLNSNIEMEISSLEVEARGKKDYFIVAFVNGDRIPFNQLPQGYKRIFSMVLDIANRSYFLNKNCDPSGIVLIDEIEQHLHPSLAQEILNRLRRSFSHIQFIISTHSPLVITNYQLDNADKLYQLEKSDRQFDKIEIGNLFGVDYNSGLKEIMGTPPREAEVNDFLDAYRYWKTAEDEEMMLKVKSRLKEIIGEDNPVLRTLEDE